MSVASKIYIVLFIILATVYLRMYIQYENDDSRFYVRAEENHRLVVAEISAYTSSVDETDDTPTLMADGTTTRHGAIACPSKYSFGTQVQIGDDKYFCSDRMNKRYRDSEHFDIWVESKEKAFAWGRRTLTIKIIHDASR